MNRDKLEISLLVGGFLIAIAGKFLGLPIVVSIGIGIVSLDIALVGVEGIVTRKMTWGITIHTSETYQGIAAVSLGLILLIAGIGFGALVIAQAFHTEQSLLELVFSRPGFLFLLIGGVMLLRGLAGVIGALEWNKNALTRFGAILERVASLFLFLLGAVLLILGAFDIIAPKAFQQLISAGWRIFLGLLGVRF